MLVTMVVDVMVYLTTCSHLRITMVSENVRKDRNKTNEISNLFLDEYSWMLEQYPTVMITVIKQNICYAAWWCDVDLQSDTFSICRSNGAETPSRESFSSDSDVDELLHRHGWHRRTTPAIDKIRTLESLSTDALDPDSIHHEHHQQQTTMNGPVRADTCTNPQRRLSRPRDRTIQRRSYSPLLDSSERNHYTVNYQRI